MLSTKSQHSREMSQKGMTAFMAVIFLSMIAFVPVAFYSGAKRYHKNLDLQLKSAQADNIARAGLLDTLSWFRQQPTQPVRKDILHTHPDEAFDPQSRPGGLSDTDDPVIGIVREYPLTDDSVLWGRYEIKKQKDPAVSGYDPRAVHDITDQRMQGYPAGSGFVWYIESAGYVYRKKDPKQPFNVAPNEVVGRSRVSTEIIRIAMNLPRSAAVIINDISSFTILGNLANVAGDNRTGLAYYKGTPGTDYNLTGSSVTGNPPIENIFSATNTAINAQEIFGVTPDDLKRVADISVRDFDEFPTTYPEMGLIFIDDDAEFGGTKPLIGGGILYVRGDLKVPANSPRTIFHGLIFVEGDAVLGGCNSVFGAMIVEGALTLDGNCPMLTVNYNEGVLNDVRQKITQYRENRAALYNFSSTK